MEDGFAIEDAKSDLRLAGFIGGNHGCQSVRMVVTALSRNNTLIHLGWSSLLNFVYTSLLQPGHCQMC